MSLLQEARASCLSCVRKHLAQALVLMGETRQDYPGHRWIAIGHMAEAGDECCKDFPELSAEIRKHRLKYMADPDYVVPVMKLIEKATALVVGEDIEMPFPSRRPLKLIEQARLLESIALMVSQLQKLNTGQQTPERAAKAKKLTRQLDAALSSRERKEKGLPEKTNKSWWPW